MAENGKFVERRKRRPHQDWHIWYVTWRAALDPLVEELRVLKMSRARHGLGAPQRQHRAAVLRAQVRMLLRIRSNVRADSRIAAEDARGRDIELSAKSLADSFSTSQH